MNCLHFLHQFLKTLRNEQKLQFFVESDGTEKIITRFDININSCSSKIQE
jgi:hypothetical protein